MNQSTRLSAMMQFKQTPNRSSFNEQMRQQSNQKKSNGLRYQKPNSANYDFTDSNIVFIKGQDREQLKLVETNDVFTQPQGFFFKNEALPVQQMKNTNAFIKVNENLSFRKSPSFRVKQQALNHSHDTYKQNNELSDNSNDSKTTQKQTKKNRSESGQIQGQNIRKTRITALENYIKGMNDEQKTPQSTMNQKQKVQLPATLANTQVIVQKKFLSKNTSELKKKGFETTDQASIALDMETNIEEMHFYFVEFQQKSKIWMFKIEQKLKLKK